MWTIDPACTTARLQLADLTGEIDLARPWLGFRPQNVPAEESAGIKSLLGIDLPSGAAERTELAPVEFFVRGDDLIATYPESSGCLRLQIYWRALRGNSQGQVMGLELIVSVQTDLLDSQPVLFVRSELGPGRLQVLGPTGSGAAKLNAVSDSATDNRTEWCPSPPACMFVPANAKLAYLEMPFPLDTRRTTVGRLSTLSGSAPSWVVEHELMREFLEKGVIRRCRLRGMFVPIGDATSAKVTAAVEQFRASAPPLTA